MGKKIKIRREGDDSPEVLKPKQQGSAKARRVEDDVFPADQVKKFLQPQAGNRTGAGKMQRGKTRQLNKLSHLKGTWENRELEQLYVYI